MSSRLSHLSCLPVGVMSVTYENGSVHLHFFLGYILLFSFQNSALEITKHKEQDSVENLLV